MASTRGGIRTGVRYYLGEYTPGIWSDEELNFFIQEACNEHAKRAYSVKTVIYTSSIRGVQDYALPPNFGELSGIRFRNDAISDEWGLTYTEKDVLRNWGSDGGDPYYYYREQDSFGLFPIPNKPLVIECAFENACPGFTHIFDRETNVDFQNDMILEVAPDATEPLEMEVPDTDLDPRCVWVSEVSVYLRRSGTYFPGNLWMSMTNLTSAYDFVHLSGEITAASINSRPEWVHFDFTQNPIEINPTEQTYRLRIHSDEDYRTAIPTEFGGEGVLIGTQDDDDGTPRGFFQMHRLRNDLENEYYQDTCDLLEDDDQELQMDGHDEAITAMVLEKANLKASYNPQAAAIWKTKADQLIKEAKATAIIPTLGKRREIRQSLPRLSNLTYNQQTELFTLRLS